MKREEVSRVELQRAFSHRLTAKELDEITYQLDDAQRIVIKSERIKGRRGRWRTFYFDPTLKALRELEYLDRESKGELDSTNRSPLSNFIQKWNDKSKKHYKTILS